MDSKNQQLAAEIEAHKTTKDNLEKARRDAKKKNVLSLEMEDYERSMKELTTKMEEKKKKMIQVRLQHPACKIIVFCDFFKYP